MLTTQQKKVQDFIRAFIQRHGHSPSLREIGEGVDIQSRGAVHRHVQNLIDRGVLKRRHSGWRTLELVETAEASNSLPLLGKIAAGRPIEAIPGHDEINLAEMLLGEERYVLQVEGDSMIDAGILDADKNLLEELSIKETLDLFEDGTLQGGMIPKVKCCLDAINDGVGRATILDGRVENSVLLELFTNSGIGTQILGNK